MMMSEFIDRTGFEPTYEEYQEIEEAYYNFAGNKDEFCAKWLADGGVMNTCRARAKKIDRLNSKILELDRSNRQDDEKQLQHIADLEKRIADLEAQLDRELEWQSYEDEHNFSQQAYDELLHTGGTKVMSDEEARAILADEFGFSAERIEIIHENNMYEINRHRQLRKARTAERLPIWNATDWQYIRFNVGNWFYEMYDGELHKFFD